MNAQEMLNDLRRIVALQLNPAPMYVYKPRNDGSGVALKLNLRLTPNFASEDGNEFIKETEGGLFMEIVAQAGKTEDGKFAKFAWTDDSKKVTAKLGLNDQLALLTGIRQVRLLGKPVPEALRPKQGDRAATTVSLFHKFGKGSTAINYSFDANSSMLGVSKSKDHRKQVSLSLTEELQFERYLTLSLDAYIKLGLR